MKNTIFDLTGKCALVTGGSRGLGKAMTRIFAEAGADVFICSRTEGELKSAADEISKETGRRIEYAVVDLTDRSQVDHLAKEAVDRLGKIDILVNNAGFNIVSPIDQIKDEDFDMLMELNLRSVMALTRAIVPGMKERQWGRVIHISSIMGLASTEARNTYSATKTALIGLARASALDLGRFGVTVNCIAPGLFATELPMSIFNQEQQDSFAERTAIGRWGRPDELAGPALLLASDAGGYITGTTLVVDGGVLARVF